VVSNLGVVTVTPAGPVIAPTSYTQVYHEGITAIGASASRTFGEYNVAMEGSIRRNQDLASSQAADLSGLGAPATNNTDNPGYAVGDTAHINTRDGVALRFVLEPTYRSVFNGVDIGVPIGIGWAPNGSRPMAMNPSAWIPEGGGDISLGLNASVKDAWRFTLAYTHYFGEAKTFNVGANNAYSWGQALKDRDFLSASLRYSF
jgi:hypothetical protein